MNYLVEMITKISKIITINIVINFSLSILLNIIHVILYDCQFKNLDY